MALIDDMKLVLRVGSDKLDGEVEMMIAAAIADMKRVGVREECLAEESMHPLVKMAVSCYCKWQFGYDNAEATRFFRSYRSIVADLLNSQMNSACEDGANGTV